MDDSEWYETYYHVWPEIGETGFVFNTYEEDESYNCPECGMPRNDYCCITCRGEISTPTEIDSDSEDEGGTDIEEEEEEEQEVIIHFHDLCEYCNFALFGTFCTNCNDPTFMDLTRIDHKCEAYIDLTGRRPLIFDSTQLN